MKYNNKPIDLSVKTLRMAVKKQDILGVKRLVTRENVNKKAGCTANTILHSLAARKDEKSLAIVAIILANGADVNIEDKNGNTPKNIAIHSDNLQMTALLSDTLPSEQPVLGLNPEATINSCSFFKANKLSRLFPIEKIEVEIDPSFVLYG